MPFECRVYEYNHKHVFVGVGVIINDVYLIDIA